MSYEGEHEEKPQIYGDPSEDNIDWEHVADEHSGAYDEQFIEIEYECPTCGAELFIDDDKYFICEICGLHGYYYGD